MILAILVVFALNFLSNGDAWAQQKKNIFQTGERLTYKVKFGFIKLGTVVVETGQMQEASRIKARLKFWTAQVPFLNTKDDIDDVIDTSAICLIEYDDHGQDGEKKSVHSFTYDPGRRSIFFHDNTSEKKIVTDVRPFSDALTLFFNLRSWNGSGGNYFFPLRGHGGEKLVNCIFSRTEKDIECPAFEDKNIPTYIVNGHADMGNSSPLGATGKFTAYVTKDEAAIPIRIDMSIAIGSISIILDKAERIGWQP